MNLLPYFALSANILLFGVGCTSISVTPESPAQPSAKRVMPETEYNASVKPPASRHQELVENSYYGRYLRGEITRDGRTEYFCLPSGRFNIAPDGAHLLMQMNCLEQQPPSSREAVTTEVDVLFPRLKNETDFFQVPFGKSIVSVENLDGARVVKFHYRDQTGEYHHVELDRREEEGYAYSLAGIADDEAAPIGHRRLLVAK